ncbi:unnamed protein product [Orchesella dallaii]|uniref:Conserved oligomeric Golgi complex subunit 6 n=1 Tax=Orchesella dallaii TaxID=48710 RepID=A0ABP1RNE2_9HEXA
MDKSRSEVQQSLQQTVNGVLELRIASDQKLLDGLEELSKVAETDELIIPPKNRKTHRHDLKSLIQRQHIASYRNFLSDFKEVKDAVGTLHSELGELNKICGSMANNLWVSKQNSRNLIDEISKLESERRKLISERDIAQAYLNAFQLNTDDLRVLRGTDNQSGTLSEEFFEVFEKIQKIQSNVAVLLKIGHQTTAVEIMDQMGLFQETALEKIYRWAQIHCKNVENPELSEVLSKSLSYLQIRPMLLKYVLDEYCAHRRSLVVRNFIDALTGVGNIKGIELSGSADPARYIGDMLAWIHQSIPGEKENLMILLKKCNKIDLSEKITNALATIIDGVCRPLNVRMEQTILSGLDCSVMNRIDIRIQFFVDTLDQVLPGSNLLITLRELQTLCHQTFINQLKCQVQAELGEYRPPGPDLTPSSSIDALITVLHEILHDTTDASPQQMNILIQLVVPPLVTQINEVANRLGSPEMGVYLCNCLNQIIQNIEKYPTTEQLRRSLKGQIEMQIDRLSTEQSSWLVAQMGVAHIFTILQEKIKDPLSNVPGMDAASLKIFVNKLDSLIHNPDSVLLPQILHVIDPQTKVMIQKQSFRILVAIYKQVYEAVNETKNAYPKDLLNLEPDQLEKSLCG